MSGTRVRFACAVAFGFAFALAFARNAWAQEAAEKSKKQRLLEEKQAPHDAALKKRWEKQLANQLGKPPAPIVNLRNGWTDETLVLDAKPDATVEQETWNRFLRCHFTNQKTQVDARLIKALVGAALHFHSPTVYIVSGFRAPKFNLMLRKKGREVARNSQHSEGTAVDFRLPGVPTRKLHSYVKSLRLGGVGLYPDSKFVHIDTGPIRYWSGQ